VGRKLPMHTGRLLRSFFHPVSQFIEANKEDEAFKPMIEGLEKAFGALQLSTATIAQKGMADPEEGAAAATDYLRLTGLVAMGYCFAKAAMIARGKLAERTQEAGFYKAKLATAQFFFDRILPQATAAFLAIKSGKASMMALEVEAF